MPKNIVVQRSVYNAAQELQKTAETSECKVFSLAEKKLDACQAEGDRTGVRFWREVWMYLISVSFLDAAIEII